MSFSDFVYALGALTTNRFNEIIKIFFAVVTSIFFTTSDSPNSLTLFENIDLIKKINEVI
jgi:hypothetical protein